MNAANYLESYDTLMNTKPSSNKKVVDSWSQLTNAMSEYTVVANSIQMDEIKRLSSELIKLKKNSIISDDDFSKIIEAVFNDYFENKLESLINSQIEQKINNMLVTLSHVR